MEITPKRDRADGRGHDTQQASPNARAADQLPRPSSLPQWIKPTDQAKLRKLLILSPAALISLLVLSGCVVSSANPTGQSDPATESADPTQSTMGKFGQSVMLDNGLRVTVATPKRFTPSRYAISDGKGISIKVPVTVSNIGEDPYSPTSSDLAARSGTNGDVCGEIFDTANLSDLPATIAAGATVTYSQGFKCQGSAGVSLVVTYSPVWSLNNQTPQWAGKLP